MSRKMWGRLTVCWVIRAETPLHLGGLADASEVDLVIARDGLGRLHVPGRSLFGAFRRWLEGTECGATAALDDMLGFVEGANGSASRVVIDDAVLCANAAELTEWQGNPLHFRSLLEERLDRKDGVGIDRVHGAAARGVLYDLEIVPRDARFLCRMHADADSEAELFVTFARLRALGQALCDGEIRCGGHKTRGLGKLALDAENPVEGMQVHRLSEREGLLEYLASVDGAASRRSAGDLLTTWVTRDVPADLLPPRRRKLYLTLKWQADEPVVVKGSLDGNLIDTLPYMTRCANGDLEPCIPGSSIKGALRARAEFRLRSALALDAPSSKATDRFLEQTSQLQLINRLFGEAGNDQAGRLEAPESNGQGAISVDPVYAKHPHQNRIAATDWQQLFGDTPNANEAKALSPELRDALDAAGYRPVMHTAIDRWTGSAATGQLFSVLQTDSITWDDIRIAVDLEQLGDLTAAGIALLFSVFRDAGWLADGETRWLELGHGGMRGLGSIRIQHVFGRGSASLDTDGFTPAFQATATYPPIIEKRHLNVQRLDSALREALEVQRGQLLTGTTT